MLRNVEDTWVKEPLELEKLAVNYYKKLYSLEDVNLAAIQLLPDGFAPLNADEIEELDKPFTVEEIVASMRGMGKFKAPGPDGYQPVFYQHNWDVVGFSVLHFVKGFFDTGILPAGVNDALMVLIPKVSQPEKITQFRPISLCNVLFKIITKTMVLRLMKVMPKLIGPAQSSFIPGRLSTDNIVIVQEVVHSMRRKKGKKGWMLLKLDLEKAYDRIRWDFLEDTLRVAGLSDHWVNWIIQAVTGHKMTILWNGEKTEAFSPARGLRQGDPLSPYLFVLCIERLCHLIENSIEEKNWKPIQLSRGGPKLSHICFAEASISQIRIIRGVLEKFCLMSGQKVSLEKSKIFFSKNITRDLEKKITEESNIHSTRDLGKYLGMPILQRRITKDTFGEILVRANSKLAGWKSRTLSFAGRLTLTKSVLSSLPIHAMSTALLPVSTIHKLNKISRNFLWGTTPEKKKQHLMSWSKVCCSKREGGLGIKVLSEMNKALLAKIGWRLLQDDSSLWAQILRCKYKVGNVQNVDWMLPSPNWSSSFRSVILGLRDVVLPGLKWVIGNGQTALFWQDRWLSKSALVDVVTNELPYDFLSARVCDLWENDYGWIFSRILPYVANEVGLRLRSLMVDNESGAIDRFTWGQSADGKFTVHSAYSFLVKNELPRQDLCNLFDRVWRVMVPERVRIFLWMGVNQIIMTNVERCRRHLCDNDICQVCKGGTESIIHILRDCPAMSGLWVKIIPFRRRASFFSQSLLEWLFDNLGDNEIRFECPWSTLFSMSVWWAWKWRCGNVFGSTGKCRDRVCFVKSVAKEVVVANLKEHTMSMGHIREVRDISWQPPIGNWFKMNTDGASKGNTGLAAAGGVLRDCNGEWCGGFALNIGICSAPLAELWGVYYGLMIAWENHAAFLELEVDSKIVVGFLEKGICESHPLSFLVQLCQGFLSKDWCVRITHVYREANRLADGLANYAYLLPLGCHRLEEAPDNIWSIFLEDKCGVSVPRNVSVLNC